MQAIAIKDLKKGEFFTLKPLEYPTEKQVFTRGDYDRSEKKYFCGRFSDISDGRYFHGIKTVYIDFIF